MIRAAAANSGGLEASASFIGATAKSRPLSTFGFARLLLAVAVAGAAILFLPGPTLASPWSLRRSTLRWWSQCREPPHVARRADAGDVRLVSWSGC